jgi:hypothetical protein
MVPERFEWTAEECESLLDLLPESIVEWQKMFSGKAGRLDNLAIGLMSDQFDELLHPQKELEL